jgi:hypothetical protein
MAKKTNAKALTDSVYMNLLTDFGFKKIFSDTELLIDFLRSLTGVQIKEVHYQPTEHQGDFETERKAVFDLLCTNENGEYFLVEMQKAPQDYFADRALFYTSYMIRNQAPKTGLWNFELKAVYFVGVLDFALRETASDKEVKLTYREMETYNKSILEYNDVRNALDYVGRISEQKGWKNALTGMAIKCASRGMNMVEISDLTGLSIEQVKEILQKMN